MKKLRRITNTDLDAVEWLFMCPGCESYHKVRTQGPEPVWSFNEDVDHPTFSPSLLVAGPNDEYRCHSFIENGRIRFLNDCHHEMKGQTVDIPEHWPEDA